MAPKQDTRFDSSVSDEQLLELLRKDDVGAYEQIYQRYWGALYKSVFTRVRDHALCQDIIQDVFLDIWRRRHSSEIKNLAAYLKSSIRFKMYRSLTKMKLDAPFYQEFENNLVSAWFADDRIAEKELSELLDLWIAALPVKKRRIFIMHFIEDMSTEEIASVLGISRKTVQNQIASSYLEIRKRYAHLLTILAVLYHIK